ncbi:unnamed protein product [Trichogramma brassicae]|uniref:Uncharacterized protein n=1 Tax=Trichogramma brassicae TaxID=86971 RepID=A0A6H5IQW0_9HYME|nr:unnamed protein product [Trichogramma brassicae]
MSFFFITLSVKQQQQFYVQNKFGKIASNLIFSPCTVRSLSWNATYKLVRTPPRRRGIERWEAAGARARPISCWSIDDDDDDDYYYYDNSSGAKVGVRRPPARSCTIISTKTLYTMSCAQPEILLK